MTTLSAEMVRSLLNYDADQGLFTWRPRPVLGQSDKTWNTRFAGKVAGAIRPDGYRIIGVFGTRYHAHRLAWLYSTGAWPKASIDHINGVSGDDRIINLREATHSQNLSNTHARSDSSSGIKGVHFDSDRKKWVAQICCRGKRRHLGRFSTSGAAKAAYTAAAVRLFGEFAKVE